MPSFSVTGNLVDVWKESIYPATVTVEDGKISSITRLDKLKEFAPPFILPGLIDSHVHIESSMLVPSEFARLAVLHGTVATVSDPHEIANVCGKEGVEFMIRDGNTVPFKFYFGAPSCVPATAFETAGATLDANDVEQLLQRDEIKYLSEMMNFPGVLSGDEEVMKKLAAAHRLSKPVDGHAPGLRGDKARQYIQAGITTDHECVTATEALDKLQQGMNIIIREGSAARNFDALVELLEDWSDQIMFCSDDKHPDSLVVSHINRLCTRAMMKGIDLFNVLKAACINPVFHYNLDVGLLRVGDPADFIVVKDPVEMEVLYTYINGELVAEGGQSLVVRKEEALAAGHTKAINNFNCQPVSAADLFYARPGADTIDVIEALNGQLITNKLTVGIQPLMDESGKGLIGNTTEDLLKIVVVNRYRPAKPAVAFIKNFRLKAGALASSVAHDSHNIVATGADDESICRAVNLVIEAKGGISAVSDNQQMVLPLPVGGLMSMEDGFKVAADYTAIDKMVKAELGSTLSSPFMTLSFMALLVIPHLKLSDLGLFDGDEFRFV